MLIIKNLEERNFLLNLFFPPSENQTEEVQRRKGNMAGPKKLSVLAESDESTEQQICSKVFVVSSSVV